MTDLAQYGAIGIVLTAVLGLFLWAFKRLFDHVLAQQADFTKFMNQSVDALRDVRDSINDGHEKLITHMDALTRGAVDEIRRSSTDRR
jgi:hypothetical protein